jgi:hypothetical protein
MITFHNTTIPKSYTEIIEREDCKQWEDAINEEIYLFRFLLAFANQFNLQMHHMDVKTAFLNGTLKEQVPEGVKCNENQVCKLH